MSSAFKKKNKMHTLFSDADHDAEAVELAFKDAISAISM